MISDTTFFQVCMLVYHACMVKFTTRVSLAFFDHFILYVSQLSLSSIENMSTDEDINLLSSNLWLCFFPNFS